MPPSAPFCSESLSLMPFKNVSLLLYASSGFVIWLSVKLFSLPVGQNKLLRVPLGVVNDHEARRRSVVADGAARVQKRDRSGRGEPASEQVASGESQRIHDC